MQRISGKSGYKKRALTRRQAILLPIAALSDIAADGKIASMSSTPFVHLRLHSEFSVVDGIVRIDDAVDKAASDGQGALALTDSANLFGAVRFYSAARKRGVKPIIGCDLWISNEHDRDNPSRMAVLVQDRTGYLNLCELITRAYLENPHRNRAEVRIEWFEEDDGRRARGLIALSGARYGAVGAGLIGGKAEAAMLAAQRLAAIFRNQFYLELQRTGDPRDTAQTRAALSLATRLAAACGRNASDSVSRARRLSCARSPCVHCRGLHAGRYAPAQTLHAGAVLQDTSRDGGAVCRRAGRTGQLGADCQALQPNAGTRHSTVAETFRLRME